MTERAYRTGEFSPASEGPTALFVDTSAFFAYFDPDAAEHEKTRAFFRGLTGSNPTFPYRPLYTSTYVLDELATALQSSRTRAEARDALDRVVMLAEDDALRIASETDDAFSDAVDAFHRYDDHELSFTDHMIAVQARNNDVGHVVAYDADFRTLGFTTIPRAE